MKNNLKIFLVIGIVCLLGIGFLIYKYEKEYVPYKQYHGSLSLISTLDFMLHSCSTKSVVMSQLTNEIYNQPVSLPTSTASHTGPTVGSLNEQFNSSPCGKYYIIPVPTIGGMSDPYSEPGIININISELLAKHVPGGILVRGAWDKDDQGVFTAIPSAESFAQLKNSDGAPTPYYKAGNNIYMFKTENNAKKSTRGWYLPIPVAISDVDVTTFVPGLSTELRWVAKDKTRVYVSGISAPEIDPQTVAIIPDSLNMFKDKNHVYKLGGNIDSPNSLYTITNYDPQTFTIILTTFYFTQYTYMKDKNGVYFGERKIIGADPNTFSVFTTPKLVGGKGGYVLYSYAKDNHAVYYSTEYITEAVPNADPQTFEPIDTYSGIYTFRCGKDKNAIYSGTTTVSNISECQHYSSGGE